VSAFKGASSTPPPPWQSGRKKRFQEFPEAQGRVYVTNRSRQSVPDSWSSDAERPVADDRSPIAVRDLGTFDANQRTVGRWTGTMEHGRLVTDYCLTHIQGYTSNQSVLTGHIHGPHQTPVTVNKITRSLTRLSKQLTLQSTTLSTTTLPLCCLFLR